MQHWLVPGVHRFSARLATSKPRDSLFSLTTLPGLGYRYILPHPGFMWVVRAELRRHACQQVLCPPNIFSNPITLFKTPQFPLSPLHWMKQSCRTFVNSISSNEERKHCTQETQSSPAFRYSSEQLCRILGPCWRTHCYTMHKEPWGRGLSQFHMKTVFARATLNPLGPFLWICH